MQQIQEVAAVWKLKENPTFGADLAHWTIIFGPLTRHLQVTSSTARIIQEPNFCHDNYNNLAKLRQEHQGAVGLCKNIMTLSEIIVLHFMLLGLSFKL